MLTPAASYTSAGRINALASAGPVPTIFVNGIGFDSSGNVLIDTNAIAGTVTDGGHSVSAAGAIYGTTTTSASDVFLGGIRLTAAGALVFVQANPASIVNGNPLDANSAWCIA